MNKEEILYNQLYERTKKFGRTQFIKELMRLERENKQLKEELSQCSLDIQELYERDIECPSNCNKLKNLQQENNQLKERIDKAIEYISTKKVIINTDVIRIFDLFEIDEQGYTDELLEILKGESNE